MNENDEYYTLNRLLSYNADINICQSVRNLGKSYDAMKTARNALLAGKNVAWSRWDRDESDLATQELLNFLGDGWKLHTISRALKMAESDDPAHGEIFFVPIKDAHKIKGIDVPFSWWIYDEFLPEFYANQIRKEEEFSKWASLHTTLRRDNDDFRALLISNNITWFNGYFRAWDIRPFPSGQVKRFDRTVVMDIGGKPFCQKSSIAFHNVKPSNPAIRRILRDEVAKGKSKEEIYQYLSNATQDKDFFIGECPDKNQPLSNVQYYHRGDYYNFREYDGHIYFCKVNPVADRATMALNKRELRDGMMRDLGAGRNFERWINRGIAKFESQEVLNAIFDLVYLSRERL